MFSIPQFISSIGSKDTNTNMDGMGLPLHEQQIQYLTTQTSALESQLAKRSHSTTEAKVQYEDMKKSLTEAINKYKEGDRKSTRLNSSHP